MQNVLASLLLFTLMCFSQNVTEPAGPANISKTHDVHKRLFANASHWDLAAEAKKRGSVKIVGEEPIAFFSDDGYLPSYDAKLRQLACSSDAVVVGSLVDAQSFLSSDNSTVFTDNTFKVETVVRSTSSQSLAPGMEIVVARPGGAVNLAGGQHIELEDGTYPPLTPTNRYVLFLKYVPESGGYIGQADGAFAVSPDESLRSLSSERLSGLLPRNLVVFSDIVRSAGCSQSTV